MREVAIETQVREMKIIFWRSATRIITYPVRRSMLQCDRSMRRIWASGSLSPRQWPWIAPKMSYHPQVSLIVAWINLTWVTPRTRSTTRLRWYRSRDPIKQCWTRQSKQVWLICRVALSLHFSEARGQRKLWDSKSTMQKIWTHSELCDRPWKISSRRSRSDLNRQLLRAPNSSNNSNINNSKI